MKVSELAKLYDAKLSDVQLEGRLMGLKDLRPNSQLAKYQADEIAKRLLQRSRARRPSPMSDSGPARIANEFLGLPHTEQQVMALLERPNRNIGDVDIQHISLRLLREGLGMSVELGAATVGVEAANLERWETDPSTPAWQVRELLAAYAVHMAAMWGFAQLRLDAHNFEEITRVPAETPAALPTSQPRPRTTSTRRHSIPHPR